MAVGQQLENRCEQVNSAAPLWVQNLQSVLLALAATTVACLVCWSLKTVDNEIAPIWFTNSVLLAQMMVGRPRQRYWVLAGGALGNLAATLITVAVRPTHFHGCRTDSSQTARQVSHGWRTAGADCIQVI